jgi:hypothetical protein
VDEDHYHGNPGMVHTLQRLGLKYGTERVCELLAQAQFASEIAALRDLEVSPCGTVTVHVRRLICAAANTLEQIRFVWSSASLFTHP